MVDTVAPVVETVPAPVVAPVEASVVPLEATVASTVEATPEVIPVTERVVTPEIKPETLLAEPLKEDKTVEPVPVADGTKVPEDGTTVPKETKEGQSDEPAPPSEVVEATPVAPTYEPFKAPEGVTLDADRVSKFTELLSELETGGKLDHALAQEFGQKAVDFHISEIQKAAEDVTKFYQTTWERTKNEWKEAFLADPEIGGNRFQTTVDAAKTFIRTHGGTAEQQAEFRGLMESSGLGNHPAMIRILAKAGVAMSEGKPLAASKPVEAPKSKTQTLYGRG